MREIKFRAWYNGKMIYPIIGDEYVNLYWCFNDGIFGAYITTDPTGKLTLLPTMQFTGLKEKNGKEIYEGDILNSLNRIKKIVKWDEKTACFIEEEQFTPKVCSWSFDMLYRKHKRAFICDGKLINHIIVGNIYENPELLNI